MKCGACPTTICVTFCTMGRGCGGFPGSRAHLAAWNLIGCPIILNAYSVRPGLQRHSCVPHYPQKPKCRQCIEVGSLKSELIFQRIKNGWPMAVGSCLQREFEIIVSRETGHIPYGQIERRIGDLGQYETESLYGHVKTPDWMIAWTPWLNG